jgi:hypothetical protein
LERTCQLKLESTKVGSFRFRPHVDEVVEN